MEIVISGRFRGPPGSGNGGYVSGLLAGRLGGGAEVSLRRPIPLDTALALGQSDAGGLELRHGDELLATARPGDPGPIDPPHVSAAEAEAATTRAEAAAANHLLPGCFGCGPARAPGDGLRILTHPLGPGRGGVHAALWRPDAALGQGGGRLAPEFLWTALDCAGGFAVMAGLAEPAPDDHVLLGRFRGRVERRPRTTEPVIVAAWPGGIEGRKMTAYTAVMDLAGRPFAVAEALWIRVALARVTGGSPNP